MYLDLELNSKSLHGKEHVKSELQRPTKHLQKQFMCMTNLGLKGPYTNPW